MHAKAKSGVTGYAMSKISHVIRVVSRKLTISFPLRNSRRDGMGQRKEEPTIVEPIDPLEGGIFHRIH